MPHYRFRSTCFGKFCLHKVAFCSAKLVSIFQLAYLVIKECKIPKLSIFWLILDEIVKDREERVNFFVAGNFNGMEIHDLNDNNGSDMGKYRPVTDYFPEQSKPEDDENGEYITGNLLAVKYLLRHNDN